MAERKNVIVVKQGGSWLKKTLLASRKKGRVEQRVEYITAAEARRLGAKV